FTTRGTVLEGMSMESERLKKKINYAIYLPPGYQNSQRDYPVVYLLHGYTDDESAWIQFGEVHLSADYAIAERKIPPMIIVMPDAGVSWYINDIAGKVPYEDMIIQEFIPFIDETYNTRAEKDFRAVAGLSMGGYGSLIWSLHHPEIFAACAAFSAAVYTDEEITAMSQDRYQRLFGNLYVHEDNNKRINAHWKNNSVIELVRKLPADELEKVRFYIDCGDDDFLYKGNSTLHMEMRDRNIQHEFRIRNGAHNWTYWRTHIIEGLEFIGESFHR
ncbi:MAG: alpha/beta hydrolase, partial [Bacteroidota bacterium]